LECLELATSKGQSVIAEELESVADWREID
jgi:hypothetical protein